MDFARAREAVARHARVTPLLPVPDLSERLGRPVLVKAECLQHTGSFKVRGAAARLESLDDRQRARGVVACSSGNHGRAVAWVAARTGVAATIYVPAWVDPLKLEGIRRAGAEAVLAGDTFDEAEVLAEQFALSQGRVYVSAYDDEWVIAGQGSLALEILEQSDRLPGAILAPLSGGGLVGGMVAALRDLLAAGAAAAETSIAPAAGASTAPVPEVVAVSAERAAVMLASLRAGQPVELQEEETLASALSGGIGLNNRYSFALVRDGVHSHVTVTETQIADAMRYGMERLRLVVEGGGAVGLAALLSGSWPSSPDDAPIVVVVSGGNVGPETLRRVLSGEA